MSFFSISFPNLLEKFSKNEVLYISLYSSKNFSKFGACPYTRVLWFITWGFNLSSHMMKI